LLQCSNRSGARALSVPESIGEGVCAVQRLGSVRTYRGVGMRPEWAGRCRIERRARIMQETIPPASVMRIGDPPGLAASSRAMTAVAERPDGTRVHFMPFPTPLHDASPPYS
jgi:hypothetical protein